MKHEKEARVRIRKMKHTLETKLLAIRMLDKNVKLEDVAYVFDVSVQTISNWRRRFERDGMDCLRRVEGQGRRPDVPLKKFSSCCRILCRRGRLTVKRLISYVRRKRRQDVQREPDKEAHARARVQVEGHEARI